MANAALDSLMPRFAVEAREAFQAHLDALFRGGDPGRDKQAMPTEPRKRRSRHQTRGTSLRLASVANPPASRAPGRRCMRALAQANAARHDWIAEEGRPDREVRGYYQRTSDFRISTTDPDATPMRLKGGGTHLGYQMHYMVDGGKRRIIVGVLVTPGEVIENQPMLGSRSFARASGGGSIPDR